MAENQINNTSLSAPVLLVVVNWSTKDAVHFVNCVLVFIVYVVVLIVLIFCRLALSKSKKKRSFLMMDKLMCGMFFS